MSTDKKSERSKTQSKTPAPDSLAKTSKKGDTELSDKELARVAGGVFKGGDPDRPDKV
jgi:bacteriocin-like protein